MTKPKNQAQKSKSAPKAKPEAKKASPAALTPDQLPWKVDSADWKGFEIKSEHTISDLQRILESEPPAEVASVIVKRIGEMVGAE